MKEVLTKSFWKGVKKTFNEALKNPTSKDDECGLRVTQRRFRRQSLHSSQQTARKTHRAASSSPWRTVSTNTDAAGLPARSSLGARALAELFEDRYDEPDVTLD
jgi:hypothetical protein